MDNMAHKLGVCDGEGRRFMWGRWFVQLTQDMEALPRRSGKQKHCRSLEGVLGSLKKKQQLITVILVFLTAEAYNMSTIF